MKKLTVEEQAELSRIHVKTLYEIDVEDNNFALVKAKHRETLKTLEDRERRIRLALDKGELPSEQPELPFKDAVKQYIDAIRNNPNIDSVELESPGGRKVVIG